MVPRTRGRKELRPVTLRITSNDVPATVPTNGRLGGDMLKTRFGSIASRSRATTASGASGVSMLN
jgi:hypothetical protein